jgi:hypothetical protein
VIFVVSQSVANKLLLTAFKYYKTHVFVVVLVCNLEIHFGIWDHMLMPAEKAFLNINKIQTKFSTYDEVLPRQCPCLGLSIHGESMGVGGFDGFRQKQEYARVYPGSAPGG